MLLTVYDVTYLILISIVICVFPPSLSITEMPFGVIYTEMA